MGIQLAVLTLVSLLQSAPEGRPWLHVSAEETSNEEFTIHLNGPQKSLIKHDKHVGGNLVFYFPDVQVKAERIELEYGPVKTLRTRTVRKGSVVVLEAAESVGALAKDTHIQLEPHVAIVYHGPAIRPAPAALTKAAAPPPVVKETVSPLGVEEKVEEELLEPELLVEEVSPELFGSQKKNWGEGLGLRHAEKKSTRALAQNTEDASLLKSMRKETQGSMQNVIGGLLLALSLGLCLLWKKRKNKAAKGLDTDTIEVVAIKSLGGKHRLAVVEACGERILLATNDKTVSMLAQLGDTSQKANAFAQTLTTLEGDDEAKAFEEASHDVDVSLSEQVQEKAKGQGAKSDLAGLLFLRKNKGQKDSLQKKGKGIAA
ncbi:MAG: flagellar biosynthetic protein FliO [Myxococcota bacterium]|jgi:flagellar biogenesis protein FliO|nr:flagellar biosynthetic protein FliO [Myxococcota bacterium]